ncbi:hypothetical protein COU56_03330 [Candidatus Pacearchaeota archaeon CG10_big_fil_rev_8_21_14_0_10_31_9]|nr:MAG: hypothetical protein COU56_03330 [Candidatus Pacearchaeota archaeon CG10_big_fil_rev_8_21_14_0_10_31_9]PIZ82759.1 MAG: hypothetical protein COX97_03205 [Candidatus Pacearchaeota archaeon CG_4_10_14_0_2_um_filter_05_32_18]
MLTSNKHVFWQALLITFLIFALGLVFGVYIEEIRNDNANTIFYQSETDLFDTLSLAYLLNSQELSCQELGEVYVKFADKIYLEARNVRQFDDSSKITSSTKYIHKKYDLLRTILWINIIDIQKKCPDINSIVYLYEYNTDDLNKKAEQGVFAKILSDLKDKEGNSFILIPIAVDNDIYSLNSFIDSKNIKEFPVIIINDKNYIYNLTTVEELEKYLK